MPDVERLLAGHTTVGEWSLGQICRHLAVAFRLTVGGGAAPVVPWAVRRAVGPVVRRVVLYRGRLPAGVRMPNSALAPGDCPDPRAEADDLGAAIGRFLAFPGPLPEHPYLGRMTADQW